MCKCHTSIGNQKFCFIFIFIFRFFYFRLLLTNADINPMLSSLSLHPSLILARHTADCPFFWGFSISYEYIANIFYVFLASSRSPSASASPTPQCPLSYRFLPHLFLLLFFCAIFYMQIEFSSILIGFLIGYTCVYIRTTRCLYATPRYSGKHRICSFASLFVVFYLFFSFFFCCGVELFV